MDNLCLHYKLLNCFISTDSDAAITKSQDTHTTPNPKNDLPTSSPNNDLTNDAPPIPPALGNGTLTLPALNDVTPKPPGTSDTSLKLTGLSDTSPKPPGSSDTSPKPLDSSNTTPGPQGSTPPPSGAIVTNTTPPTLNTAKPTAQNDGILTSQENLNVPASEVAKNTPIYHATPNPTMNQQPTITANEIGLPNTPKPNPIPAWTTPNPTQFLQTSYTAPLKQEIKNLDNVLQKRIQTQSRPVFSSLLNSAGQNNGYSPINSGTSNGYEQWSSYGPCSVTCGVGMRRRTRICRPGVYCIGSAAESRACINEQCACEYRPLQHHRNVKQDRNTILYLFLANCIHTTGGTVREGSCCHFPFSFNGAQYYHCLLSPTNNERMWCATTPYFEQDRQWGYCPRSSKNYKLFFICQH